MSAIAYEFPNNYNSGTLFFFMDIDPLDDSVTLGYKAKFQLSNQVTTLTLYFFILEASENVKFSDYNFRYKDGSKFAEALMKCSDHFLLYPDTVINEAQMGLDQTVAAMGDKNIIKSGLFAQLSDYINNKIYYSDTPDVHQSQYLKILEVWTEDHYLEGNYLTYIKGEFDLDLINTDDQEILKLEDGKFQLSFYTVDW